VSATEGAAREVRRRLRLAAWILGAALAAGLAALGARTPPLALAAPALAGLGFLAAQSVPRAARLGAGAGYLAGASLARAGLLASGLALALGARDWGYHLFAGLLAAVGVWIAAGARPQMSR